MTGPITITSPQTGRITAQQAGLVERGPDPKTQIHSTAFGVVRGRPFLVRWSYTAVPGGGHVVIDITGGISAHVEGQVGPGTIAPLLRNYYDIFAGR
jgi:hypothetical protein